MKILNLNEKIDNLNKVVNSKNINAVTEMPPVMSDAYEDSLEHDEYIEKGLKDSDKLPTDEPFLGADDQPVPDDIEEAKINLEESLFEDLDRSGYQLHDDFYSFKSDVYNAVKDVCNRYRRAGNDVSHEDISDALEWFINVYSEDEDIDECLYEEDEIRRPERKTGKGVHKVKDEEDEDLWSLVYTSLIEHPDEANYAANHAYDIDQLKKEQRYSDVYTDYDGNIVVYAENEEELAPAKEIAAKYNLEVKQDNAPESTLSNRPNDKLKLTIIIPDEEIFDND